MNSASFSNLKGFKTKFENGQPGAGHVACYDLPVLIRADWRCGSLDLS
jgi:hypothetical protein